MFDNKRRYAYLVVENVGTFLKWQEWQSGSHAIAWAAFPHLPFWVSYDLLQESGVFSSRFLYNQQSDRTDRTFTIMDNGGQIFGLILAFIIFVPWGWVKLSNKNRGWGYYVLLILWPLIGFIVACCLSKKEKNVEQAPENDITNVQ